MLRELSHKHARSQQLGRIVVPRTQEHRMPTNLWRLALFRKMELGALWGYRAVSVFFCGRGAAPFCVLCSKARASAIFPTLTALSVVRPVALFAERGSARLFGARFSRGPLTSLRQRRRERAGQLEFSAARPSAVRKQRAPPSAGGWRSWKRGPPLRELTPGVLWQPPRQIAREL